MILLIFYQDLFIYLNKYIVQFLLLTIHQIHAKNIPLAFIILLKLLAISLLLILYKTKNRLYYYYANLIN